MNSKIIGIVGLVCSGLSLAACSFSVVGGFAGAVLTGVFTVVLLLGASTTQTGCSTFHTCLSMVPPDAEDTDDGENVEVGPCLTAPLDTQGIEVGPCLSVVPPDTDETEEDVDVGPCLSPPPPDTMEPPDSMEPRDTVGPGDTSEPADTVKPADTSESKDVTEIDVGPCLSLPPPDTMEPSDTLEPDDGDDPDVGPCLSPPLDTNEPADSTEDAEVGPCLSPPAPKDIDEPETDIGPCLSPPPPPPPSEKQAMAPGSDAPVVEEALTRAEITAKLIADGTLPEDVAARLQEDG